MLARRAVRRSSMVTMRMHFKEAMHRLIEKDEVDIESLRVRLQQADAEIDRGEGIELDERTTKSLANHIHQRGLKRLA